MSAPVIQRKRIIKDDEDEQPYQFVEDTEGILKKFENEQPSLELHIYNTHFKFGNLSTNNPTANGSTSENGGNNSNSNIIPKSSPLIKLLFEYIANESIPPAATEVFRDCGIKFYQGCIILKLIDYRKNNQNPPGYRVLLKPSPLSLWHDLLYTTDTTHGRFTDSLALSMESEILNLTIRNVNLGVESNCLNKIEPRKSNKITKFSSLKEANRKLHQYRPAVYKRLRGLHQELSHHGTEYEELMLIMDEHHNHSNASNNNNQFLRLSYIETLRKKTEQKRMQVQQRNQQPMRQSPQQQSPNQFNNNAASAFQQMQNRPTTFSNGISFSANAGISNNNTTNANNNSASANTTPVASGVNIGYSSNSVTAAPVANNNDDRAKPRPGRGRGRGGGGTGAPKGRPKKDQSKK